MFTRVSGPFAPETSFDGYEAPMFLQRNAPGPRDEPKLHFTERFVSLAQFVFVFFGSSGTEKTKRLWGGT